MRVFLIGFMGSGKTTLGKQLARKLGYRFVDQDHYIESKTGMSIADFFTSKGEQEFRNMEHQALKELILLEDVVVATGGGAPCFFNNMDLMNQNGIAIYIKVKPEILKSRLKNAQEERPLLRGKSEQELLDFIKSKLGEREDYYSKATHVIESLDLKSEDLYQLIKYYKAN
jgi:shikimate kinase